MKVKYNLLIFIFITTISCSNNDDSNSSDDDDDETPIEANNIIKLSVDGVIYSFDSFTVSHVDSQGLLQTQIEAFQSNSIATILAMRFIKNTENDFFEEFTYEINGENCTNYQGHMVYDVELNDFHFIKGFFSGEINCNGDDDDESIISDGEIDITF